MASGHRAGYVFRMLLWYIMPMFHMLLGGVAVSADGAPDWSPEAS